MLTLLEFLLRFLFDFFARFPLLVTQISLEDLSRTSGGGGFSIKMLPQPPLPRICPRMCYYCSQMCQLQISNPLTLTHLPSPLRHLVISKTKVTRDTDSDGHTVVNAPEILLSAPSSLSEPAMHILTFFLLRKTKYTHLWRARMFQARNHES